MADAHHASDECTETSAQRRVPEVRGSARPPRQGFARAGAVAFRAAAERPAGANVARRAGIRRPTLTLRPGRAQAPSQDPAPASGLAAVVTPARRRSESPQSICRLLTTSPRRDALECPTLALTRGRPVWRDSLATGVASRRPCLEETWGSKRTISR